MSAVMQRVTGAIAMNEARSRNGVPAEVHALLTLWGNWRRRMSIGPQGFPKESPFCKAALYGELGIPQQSNVRDVEGSMPGLVEWIDRIVEADTFPSDYRRVIEARYRSPLTPQRNLPSAEAMARSCSMSLSTFRNRLESAQVYVFAKMYP